MSSPYADGTERVIGNFAGLNNPYQQGSKGSYWKGADGNVWVAGDQGTNSAGKWDDSSSTYWGASGYSLISDPNAGGYPNNSLGAATTNLNNPGSGSSQTDPTSAALYQQAIGQAEAGIGNLDAQRQVGIDNVNSDYRSNFDRLMNARNTTERKYNESVDTTKQDNLKARSNIDFETGQRANALQRLLGSKGAGASSAARLAAPYAAALEGTQQLNQVSDQFKGNMGQLDSNWNAYQTDWNQSKDDLEAQKVNQLRAVDSDINSKRQQLLQSIAGLQAQRQQALGASPGATVAAAQPYINQVNQLQRESIDLGRNYAGRVNVADPTYQQADLSAYDYNQRGQIGTAQNAQQQTVSPYLSVLLGEQKRKEQLV